MDVGTLTVKGRRRASDCGRIISNVVMAGGGRFSGGGRSLCQHFMHTRKVVKSSAAGTRSISLGRKAPRHFHLRTQRQGGAATV